MPTLHVNEADLDALIRSRESLFTGSLDAKRPLAWRQYGYKSELAFQDYLNAYERGGAGYGAVHRILDKCWQDVPRIKSPASDKETPWETKLQKLFTKGKVWLKLRELDRRNMVGRYAGLVYRIADGKKLNEPLLPSASAKLVDLVPLYENQIRVERWDENPESETYGTPLMFEVETAPPTQRDQQGRPRTWLKVHPSRIQLLAEGSAGGNFLDGVPLLKAGFNALVDIEKLSGGGAENALKNSSRTISFEFEAGANPQVLTQNADGTQSTQTVRQAMEERTRLLNSNIDSSIVLQGGKAQTLKTDVGDLSSQFNIAANIFSASVRIPFTIQFGQQTGRLASDEDQKEMNGRCSSRRTNELTPAVTEFVERMQLCGVIEAGEFVIEWPPLDAPTDTQRLDNASKMAAINKANSDAGQAAVFDGNEIRKAVGYEEVDELEGIPLEGEPEPEPVPVPGPAPKPALKAA